MIAEGRALTSENPTTALGVCTEVRSSPDAPGSRQERASVWSVPSGRGGERFSAGDSDDQITWGDSHLVAGVWIGACPQDPRDRRP